MSIQAEARAIIESAKVALTSDAKARGRAQVAISDFLYAHGEELDRVGNSELVDELGQLADRLNAAGVGEGAKSVWGAGLGAFGKDVSGRVSAALPSSSTLTLIIVVVAGVFVLNQLRGLK